MAPRQFHTARQAKEFLVLRIIEEAVRENVPLSEVERKMLYFSETDWTLPDMMQVNEEFDRNYDQDEYEKKIRVLVRNAAEQDRTESRDLRDRWLEAVRLLEKEDHYLLVMIKGADLRPRGDQMKLFIAGVSVAAVVIGYIVLVTSMSEKYGSTLGKYAPPGTTRIIYYLIIVVAAVIAYRMGWLTRR